MFPKEKHINWFFDDNNILNMIETDLRKMEIAGFFINTVYRVETQLKSLKFNILLEK